MQTRYIVGAPSSIAQWTPLDWMRNPMHVGLSVVSTGVAWAINVTMDDPTGRYPNPVLNPGYPTALTAGSSGAIVNSFAASQVGGWAIVSSAQTGVSISSGTGNAIGGIGQPVAAIQFIGSSQTVLTILQAGPR